MSLVASLNAGLSSATASWMLFSLLVGGLVLLAALAAHDAQRAANRAVRWVWFSAIGVIVALSLAAPLRPAARPMRLAFLSDSGVASGVASRVDARTGLAAWWSRSRDAVVIPVDAALQVVASTLDRIPAPVQRALAAAWLLATLATLGIFGVSYLRIRRQMRRWPVHRVGDVSARIAPTAGPAVVGLAPSEIILPSWLLASPADEQRLVVAHESEHVRAGDPWLLVLACGAVACMPWHPALWFALGRLRLAIELDCDRRVLQRGVPARAYGALLIELSALRPSFPSAMPAFSCNGSYLERRLVAMTSRPSRFAPVRRIGGGLIAAVALITACESKLPTSAEVERMDVAGAVDHARRIALVDSGRTVYVVDGERTSRDAAKTIEANRIASVEVVKGAGRELSEIRIVTVDSSLPRTAAPDRATRRAILELNAARMRDTSRVVEVALRADQGSLKRSFDGLVVLDGVIVESSVLQRMNTESIGSIEVIKGAAAQKAYSDLRAANGVIKVTTKPKP